VRTLHLLFPERLQRALKAAIAQASIRRLVRGHSLCHSFATHVLQRGTGTLVNALASRSDSSGKSSGLLLISAGTCPARVTTAW
jgi:integrase